MSSLSPVALRAKHPLLHSFAFCFLGLGHSPPQAHDLIPAHASIPRLAVTLPAWVKCPLPVLLGCLCRIAHLLLVFLPFQCVDLEDRTSVVSVNMSSAIQIQEAVWRKSEGLDLAEVAGLGSSVTLGKSQSVSWLHHL